MANLWSKKEDDMIFNPNFTNYEIALKTGRSLMAVQKRRYDLTGTYSDNEPIQRPHAVHLSHTEKISRLYRLADKLGVKFGDMLK